MVPVIGFFKKSGRKKYCNFKIPLLWPAEKKLSPRRNGGMLTIACHMKIRKNLFCNWLSSF
jgi:hypothetical protein